MSQGESHRRRISVKRASRRRAALSAADIAARERAEMQREIARQLRVWTPRKIIAYVMVIVAGLIAVNHIFMHLGFSWLPMSAGSQDLFVGWPIAAVIAVSGFVVGGQTPQRRS